MNDHPKPNPLRLDERVGSPLIMIALVLLGVVLVTEPAWRALAFPEYFAALMLFGTRWLLSANDSGVLGQGRERDRERARDVRRLANFFAIIIIFGFYLLVRLGWTEPANRHRILFVILVWGIAALAGGGLLGFLFGIPRTLAGSQADREAEARNAPAGGGTTYRVNTNLERISDWLTHILVGGTVTQLAALPSFCRKIGAYYGSALGVSAGATVSNWEIAGVGSTLYFVFVGFLGSYLITRLYLAGAIQRADDESGKEQVKQLSQLTQVELEALEAAPLNYAGEGTAFDPLAKAAADKILELPLETLTHWRDLRVWAKAQLASAGALLLEGKTAEAATRANDAIKAYVRVIEVVPDDAETRLGYAIALGAAQNRRTSVLTQLERARDSLMPSSSPELRKNVYKSLIFATLYLKKPESFLKAFAHAREYFRTPEVPESAGIMFNIACAFGQAYTWLKTDPTRRLMPSTLSYRPFTGEDILLQNNKALADARAGALKALQIACERSPGFRQRLKEMLTIQMGAAPDAEADDDLICFADDPDFRAQAGLDKTGA